MVELVYGMALFPAVFIVAFLLFLVTLSLYCIIYKDSTAVGYGDLECSVFLVLSSPSCAWPLRLFRCFTGSLLAAGRRT